MQQPLLRLSFELLQSRMELVLLRQLNEQRQMPGLPACYEQSPAGRTQPLDSLQLVSP